MSEDGSSKGTLVNLVKVDTAEKVSHIVVEVGKSGLQGLDLK